MLTISEAFLAWSNRIECYGEDGFKNLIAFGSVNLSASGGAFFCPGAGGPRTRFFDLYPGGRGMFPLVSDWFERLYQQFFGF